MTYLFLDANSSILTADSDVVASAHRPIVEISSVLSPIPTTFSGSPSISGTVNIGTIPGSVVALNSNPSSLLTGASILGQLPAGTAVLGSVMVLQGTNPWNISSIYGNVSGSVLAQQLGTHIVSVVGSIPSSLLTGNYAQRNDAVASALGADLTWRPLAVDSAGRSLNKPFAAEESRIEGYASVVSTSVTTLVAAAGTGLRNYITDLWFANTGAAATLVTLKDGAGSVLGYTIAPAGSGSNLPGLQTPIRTGANATFDFQAATGTSVLYATVKGFKAP